MGRVRGHVPGRSTPPSTSTGPRTSSAVTCCRVCSRSGDVAADQVGEILRPIHGHPMAKAALEMAVLDAELRGAGVSLAETWAQSAPRSTAESRSASTRIRPSWSKSSAVTSRRATAASSSRSSPAMTSRPSAPFASASRRSSCKSTPTPLTPLPTRRGWRELDQFDLLLIEQPLPEDDVRGHAELARLLRHADLSRRVDHLVSISRRRHRSRRMPRRQHQGRPCRRLSRGPPRPRRLRSAWRTGLVRRHARNGARSCSQCCLGGSPRTSRCPETPQPRAATTRRTSPSPSSFDHGRLEGSAGSGARCRRRSRRSSTSSRPRSRPSGQRVLCHRASSPSSRNCSSSTRRSSAFFTSMSKSSPRRRSR